MYALDTNTVIYFFKGQGRVAERLLATPPMDIALPAIVAHELLVGAEKSVVRERRLAELDRFLEVVTVLPFGLAEARAAARIRADLEARGQVIGPYGLLIGASALVHGAVLVTRNLREFDRIRDLRAEDWFG